MVPPITSSLIDKALLQVATVLQEKLHVTIRVNNGLSCGERSGLLWREWHPLWHDEEN
jgi:hypothetical protein